MTANYHFRSARPDDLPAVVRLLADDDLGRQREDTDVDTASGAVPDYYRAAFAEIARDEHNDLIVAERDGAVVATLQITYIPSLTHRGGERAQIEGVRVAASERGQGLGRLLFEWVIAQAEARGCRMVQLTTDKRRPDAHRFYAALGFQPTHEGMKLMLPRSPGD